MTPPPSQPPPTTPQPPLLFFITDHHHVWKKIFDKKKTLKILQGKTLNYFELFCEKNYKVRLSCQNKPARLSSCSQDTGSMPILGVNDHSSQRTSFHNLVSGRMYAAPKPSHAYPYHMWQRSFTYGSEVLQCSNRLVPIRKWRCTSFHNMTGPLWY